MVCCLTSVLTMELGWLGSASSTQMQMGMLNDMLVLLKEQLKVFCMSSIGLYQNGSVVYLQF